MGSRLASCEHLSVFSLYSEFFCYWRKKDLKWKVKWTEHFKTKSLILSFCFDLFYLLEKGRPSTWTKKKKKKKKFCEGCYSYFEQKTMPSSTFCSVRPSAVGVIISWCCQSGQPLGIASGLNGQLFMHTVHELYTNIDPGEGGVVLIGREGGGGEKARRGRGCCR